MCYLAIALLFSLSQPSWANIVEGAAPAAAGRLAATFALIVLMLGAVGGKRAGISLDPVRDLDRGIKRSRFGSCPYLAAIGAPHLATGLYQDLALELDTLMAFESVYDRPAAKLSTLRDSSDNKFLKPVHKRLVKSEDDRWAHFDAACKCEHPSPDWRSKYTLPENCKRALGKMLALRNKLPKWRRSQVDAIQSIARRAAPITAALKDLPIAQQSQSVRNLEQRVRQINVGMLCLFCTVLHHPDIMLPRQYLTGFNVCGLIPPSGVLRPLADADSSLDSFWQQHAQTMRSNGSWAHSVARDVAHHGASATGKRKSMLQQVWSLTEAEVAKGTSGPGMTLKALEAKYGQGAAMRCRVIARHGVHQGFKQARDHAGRLLFNSDGSPQMVDKIRLIDDSKRNLANSHLQRTTETIAPCRFTFMGYVAQELVRLCQTMGIKPPQLVFSLDDLQGAYRQVPTADPEMCIVCVYSFAKGDTGPRFYECHGHTFGHVSSVSNFNRTPLFICQISRVFLAIPQEAYFDDYCTPDFRLPGCQLSDCGAASALNSLHRLLGFRLEPHKHQPADVTNDFLGVTTNTSHVSDSKPFVEFRPSSRRTERVMDMLRTAAAENFFDSALAKTVRGKLAWILQAAWGSVGRAGLQPLRTRCGDQPFLLPGGITPPPEGTCWTPALQTMSDFFDLLFRHLPPLRWYLGTPLRKNLVLYTDAQYSAHGRKGVGVILADRESGLNYICGGLVSDELLTWISSLRDIQPHINHCELLAVVVALMTFPDILYDRDVLLFVDNMTALKCLVDGYSAYPELATLSNVSHILLASLRSRCYSLHVPGLANPADIPSRVPFIRNLDGNFSLDPSLLSAGKTGPSDVETVRKIAAHHRPMVSPTAAQLRDINMWSCLLQPSDDQLARVRLFLGTSGEW